MILIFTCKYLFMNVENLYLLTYTKKKKIKEQINFLKDKIKQHSVR